MKYKSEIELIIVVIVLVLAIGYIGFEIGKNLEWKDCVRMAEKQYNELNDNCNRIIYAFEEKLNQCELTKQD